MYQGGRRSRGKSVTRWTDKVKGALAEVIMGLEWLVRVHKDGKAWEKAVLDMVEKDGRERRSASKVWEGGAVLKIFALELIVVGSIYNLVVGNRKDRQG